MRSLALLAAALLLSACGATGAATERPAPTPDPWTAHRDASRGYTISVPPGWQVAQESLTPNLSDPREIFSLATFPLRHHASECAHMPSALDDLGDAGALVTVMERGRGSSHGFGPRPARFGPQEPSSNLECLPSGVEGNWFPFTDGGRAFYGLVAFGPHATAEVRTQAFDVLTRARYDAGFVPGWGATP
jgi:hypothetical protein